MNIAVIGAGEVGFHLADILSREGHRVSVVDSDPSKSRRLMESLDVQVVVGDGTRAEVLNTAGVSKADLVVCVTDADRTNMLACALSSKLGAKRVILRLSDMRRLTGYHYFYKQTLGFDIALSTQELVADEIVATVREKHALEVESFADGRVQVRRLRLKEESEVLNKPLKDLELPRGVLVGGVARGENFHVPTGSDMLEIGDQLYLIGKAEELDAFERLAGARVIGRRSVVLMGAGSIGRQVARKLSEVSGVHLRVIERDPVRAKALAAEAVGDMMVLQGDATDIDLLIEERIGDSNIFVATSGDDERNMVACQLAKSLGVERTVAMVNKSSYRQIYDLLGIDLAISPRVLCANRILRFVRSTAIESIAVLGEGRAEVLDLQARFRGKRKEHTVKQLGLPQGSVLGAIVRDEEVTIPHGDSVVKDGDHVIVFSVPENVEAVLNVFRADEEGK
jgi:trk system potassium uptake protein TrkA